MEPQLTQVHTPVELGRILRVKRKEQKLTLQDVSEHCGFSMRFISEVERGKPTAEIGKVMALLAVVGVDLFARSR
ncbi:helix-turn-helix domain-containing protein [Geoalkalibacter sp.]|uniref:helix-turn-helix domain-containing protein n=1 Tax=Geoalkalibacter sp. TaxID=3041440 RepID=UPI00272E37B5|nr:helix-turn-helix domain-containing protein [Geoalkalibacter sp.]